MMDANLRDTFLLLVGAYASNDTAAMSKLVGLDDSTRDNLVDELQTCANIIDPDGADHSAPDDADGNEVERAYKHLDRIEALAGELENELSLGDYEEAPDYLVLVVRFARMARRAFTRENDERKAACERERATVHTHHGLTQD